MDDEKRPTESITWRGDVNDRPGPRYAFKDEPVKLSASPEVPGKVLTAADFRNAEIKAPSKLRNKWKSDFVKVIPYAKH